MTRTEPLEQKILQLFSHSAGKPGENVFVDEIETNRLTIREDDKTGVCEVSFTNGRFTGFKTSVLGVTGNKVFDYFEKKNCKVFRRICDGIFLSRSGDDIFLCLVELKKNIGNRFQQAMEQIEGSYLKTAMALSLVCDVTTLNAAAFVVGELKTDTETDYLEKASVFQEQPLNLESILNELARRHKAKVNLPYFTGDIIHKNYHKEKVTIYHLEDGDTFDVSQVLAPYI